jgi:hypothetical protein
MASSTKILSFTFPSVLTFKGMAVLNRLILARLAQLATVGALLFVGVFLASYFITSSPVWPSGSEWLAFSLFPLTYFFALLGSFWYPRQAGAIATVCIVALFLLMPEAMQGIWFWLLMLPGVLQTLVGKPLVQAVKD